MLASVAGTEILTPDGVVDIEDVEVGDWVIADDPTTPGEIEKRQVLQTFVREVDGLVDLYVDGEVISTTEEHPFWVVDKGWVEADDLRVGDLLQTEDGVIVDIDGIEEREGEFEVYNFEVEDFHTYFVSDLEILVHNACGPNDDTINPWDDDDLWGELDNLNNPEITVQDPSASQIANGHAYDFHKDDFPGVQSRDEFAREIEGIINNPTASKQLSGGRYAYLDENKQIVVITNPRDLDGGTAYKPRDEYTQQPIDARRAFDQLR